MVTAWSCFSSPSHVDERVLLKSDTVYMIYLEISKYLTNWLVGFLRHHKSLTHFDNIQKKLPPYHGLCIPQNVYLKVTQWQGMVMHQFIYVPLDTLAVSLSKLSVAEMQPFRVPLQRVHDPIEFTLLSRYYFAYSR